MSIPERDLLYLTDMLNYAKRAVQYASETTLDALAEDDKTALAIERAIEVVGEAAKSVSPTCREQLPDLPWRDMAQTRDFFAHHYFRIDVGIMWRICQDDLPKLIQQLEAVLN
ncbi:MAG: DUF86 domain-containing protein [Deinococcota bacterium]